MKIVNINTFIKNQFILLAYTCTRSHTIITTSLPLAKSYDDGDVHPTRKTKIPIEDETTEGPSGEWKKKIAKKQAVPDLDLDNFAPKIHALEDEEREEKYMTSAREQKDRVKRIRKARQAAEVIQNAWRGYLDKRHYADTDR